MFSVVQAFHFFFLGNPQTNGFVNYFEHGKAHAKGPQSFQPSSAVKQAAPCPGPENGVDEGALL